MARVKDRQLFKKIATVVSILIACEVVYLLFFGPADEPVTVQQAIARQVGKANLAPRDAEKRKIIMSVYDFRAKNGGRLPAKLEELVPIYFDRVPNDPESGQPFKYILDNGTPYVGEKEEATVQLTDANGKALSSKAQTALIESLSEQTTGTEFVYDASGKRDPFRPFDFAPKVDESAGKTPLEKYSIGALKLTAVLGTGEEATAMVENAAGKGFPVRKGTKIGTNSGEVADIQQDRIIILEKSIDFTGQEKTKTVEMRLRTKDQEEKAGSKPPGQ